MSESAAASSPHLSTAADLLVCLDFSDPESYLALAGTRQLVTDFDLQVQWLPIKAGLKRVSNQAPTEVAEDPLLAYKARRAKARQNYAATELQRTCRLLDIPVSQGQPQADTSLAAMGLLYVNAQGGAAPAYIESVYAGLFRYAEDAPAPIEAVVSAALQAAAVAEAPFAAFVAAQGPQVLAELEDSLLALGLFASPGYLYQGQRFQGRQHLPLLRWTMQGATGTPPV
jgi:2-hydroxychromene-2-carboxylate isomerase